MKQSQPILFVCLLATTTLFAQQTASLEWAKRIGGSSSDRARGMAVDAAGNVLSSGYYSGTVDFDPGPGVLNLTSTGGSGIFISKLDATGNLVWAKSISGTAGVSPMNMAIDLSGNVYITGGFLGTTDFDPGPGVFNMTSGGQTDIFIAKYDANGNFVWAKEINGGTWFDHGYDIKVDASGNVYVVGRFYFQGGPSFDFDPGPGTFLLTAGEEDAFILKLDNNGDFVWARDFGGASGTEHRGYSIDIDNAGNVYTTGYFEATADFDPGPGTFNLTASGDWDVFISKLDMNGNFVWAKSLVNSAPTYYTDGNYGSKIKVDGAGNIYSSGRFNGTVDFDLGAGTFNITSNGNFDAYLLKLTTNGDFVWAKSWGGTGYDEAFSISLTTTDIFITGLYAGTVDFDPGATTLNLTSSGSNDIFISRFDINGNFGWARSMGGTGDDRGSGIATNSAGDVYVSGYFNTTADFDPDACLFNQTSAGGDDIFITKLNQVIASPFTITSASPSVGAVGATVVITGTGFSTIPANNLVTFNGTIAAVTASTATSITTTVPPGATTGKISVTVNCVTVQSVFDFMFTDNFVTRWNLATAGSGATQLTFSTSTSGTINYTWQEISPGSATGSGTGSGPTLTISPLPSGAIIRLQIEPTNFQRIIINFGADRNRLTMVEQWGSTVWTSMQNAFLGCSNLQVTAADVPNLSGVSNMSQMFWFCTNLNSPGNINAWNTATVTDMSGMFSEASAFNQNIGSWNTSAVTTMQNMFFQASAFNQNIGAWNTSAVTDMSSMFQGASAFNQNIGSWNTAAVNTMAFMFASASSFNQNIGTWNTAAVTDMAGMFVQASSFNQNIGSWNTAAVTNMSNMFSRTIAFNQNIGSWNTAAVTDMSNMFAETDTFNQNIGAWNTGAVTDMSSMFYQASAFNQNIGTWNVSGVTNMRDMFYLAVAFNQNIGAWDVGAVTSMEGMFTEASAFNQNISLWNTGAVMSMQNMFDRATSFNQNLGAWTLKPGVDLRNMFDDSGMDCYNYSNTLIGWNTNPATPDNLMLGANGRQYGTNAETARTNLDITKNWTITGDVSSGADCSVAPLPTILSFTPTSGPIGTTVVINGADFSSTPSDNTVQFNGIAAVVTASTPTSITTSVPAGATTGVLSVTVSGATGISATPFTVTSPVLIPGLVWARGHIGTTDTFSEAVTTDASGNVYTTGSFDQTTDFDPGPGVLNLTSAGHADIYVSKLNANGDLAWAFSMGGVTSDAGTGIATDASGNVYVAGSFSGTVDFDPGPGTTNLTGGGKFLCKFDTNGILISAIALPGTLSFDIPLAVDAADNLYLAGSFTGTADFDPGAGVFNLTSAGSSDIFVLKLSSTGSFIWAKRMGSTSLDRANALALDVNGNVHITGTFNGTVDFDPGAGTANLTSAGATDAFIQKLDNAGNYMWARRVGGTSSLDTGNGIVLDRNDNVLVTGRFDGTVDFDPGAAVNNLTSVGGGDVFVLKLTSAGIFDWAKSMGGTFADEGIDIVCDAFDNVYITGDFRSNTADFDPGPGTFNLAPTGSEEVFLSGLDAAGNFMWAIASQGAAGSSVYQPELSLDATGNIILIGVIEDAPADLDPGICVTNISTNGVTAFIVKLRPGTISSCGPTITITQQPASPTYACENSSASFTTAATGTTNITYQWQKYDGSVFVDLPNNATYSGVSMATLIINNVSTAEAGEYQCVISGDFAADVLTDVADLVVNNLPAPPGVVNGLNCGPGAVTLTASGGSPGNYRWYTDSPTLIAGEVNESFTTPVLTSTTSYFVSLVDPFCESLRVTVTATVNPLPAKPTITSSILPSAGTVTVCDAAPLVLSAPAGFTAYAWSSGETTDQINVTVAGSYTVTVTDAAGCTSPGSDPILVITDTTPALPTVAAAASCGPGSVALTASGGTNGNYRWYDVATGGTALAGEVNSMFTTPALTTSTTYYVSITNGNCESNRVAVTATINAVPAQPVITSSITLVGNAISICSTTPHTLSAPAGFSYLWSDGSTTQQITVTASGLYSVVVSSGGCSSPASEPIDVTVVPAPCTNQPPVITTPLVTTTIGSSVSINLLTLIADPDNNLVASSLAIVQGPASGAIASINSGVLDIDYSGINFAGTDLITIEVCDAFGACTQEQLEIKVIGEIEIYNAVSPNNDGKNEFFDIRYIDLLPDTQENKVTIYNRWGTVVFEVENYKEANAFRGLTSGGNEVPSGTYFYKIEFTNGRSSISGYLSLKR